MASFSIAVGKSRKNKETGEWEKETYYFDCTALGNLAENVSNSFEKGNRIIVIGEAQQRSWDDKESGAKRSKIEFLVEEIGASVKYATTVITKIDRPDFEGKIGDNSFKNNHYKSAPASSQQTFAEEPF
jgi:single-strand DNA-binding protein